MRVPNYNQHLCRKRFIPLRCWGHEAPTQLNAQSQILVRRDLWDPQTKSTFSTGAGTALIAITCFQELRLRHLVCQQAPQACIKCIDVFFSSPHPKPC